MSNTTYLKAGTKIYYVDTGGTVFEQNFFIEPSKAMFWYHLDMALSVAISIKDASIEPGIWGSESRMIPGWFFQDGSTGITLIEYTIMEDIAVFTKTNVLQFSNASEYGGRLDNPRPQRIPNSSHIIKNPSGKINAATSIANIQEKVDKGKEGEEITVTSLKILPKAQTQTDLQILIGGGLPRSDREPNKKIIFSNTYVVKWDISWLVYLTAINDGRTSTEVRNIYMKTINQLLPQITAPIDITKLNITGQESIIPQFGADKLCFMPREVIFEIASNIQYSDIIPLRKAYAGFRCSDGRLLNDKVFDDNVWRQRVESEYIEFRILPGIPWYEKYLRAEKSNTKEIVILDDMGDKYRVNLIAEHETGETLYRYVAAVLFDEGFSQKVLHSKQFIILSGRSPMARNRYDLGLFPVTIMDQPNFHRLEVRQQDSTFMNHIPFYDSSRKSIMNNTIYPKIISNGPMLFREGQNIDVDLHKELVFNKLPYGLEVQTIQMALQQARAKYQDEMARIMSSNRDVRLPASFPDLTDFSYTFSLAMFQTPVVGGYYNYYLHGWLFDDLVEDDSYAVSYPFIGIYDADNITNEVSLREDPDRDFYIPLDDVSMMTQDIRMTSPGNNFGIPSEYAIGSYDSRFSLQYQDGNAFATFIAIDVVKARVHVSFVMIGPESMSSELNGFQERYKHAKTYYSQSDKGTYRITRV